MFDVNHIIQTSGAIIGLLLIGGIILAESGIPVGFFLPGDTMLFTAGFFAAQHYLPLGWLIIVVAVGKTIGGYIGYEIGIKTGPRLFTKKDSLFFRKDYLESAQSFYDRHGRKTVVLAQFFPVIRTFAPIVAGVGKMNKKRFMTYNVIGAVIWASLVPLLGFWLGHKIHNIDKYLLPIILIATVFSFAPAGWHLFGKRDNRKIVLAKFKRSKTK